jgi:hypothetical protein
MKLLLTETQKNKLVNIIQNQINSELETLRKLSDQDELSFDEQMEVDSIVELKVVNLERKDKWIITVDIHKNYVRYSFENVLYHMSYQLQPIIGSNKVIEGEVIDTVDRDW